VGAALGAVGAEERIRAAQDRRVERREEEMEAAEQAARERAAAEAVRQAEEAARAAALAQAERLRAIAEAREEEPPREDPNALEPALRVIDEYRGEASLALRALRVSDLIAAARDVDVEQVGSTLRITGSQASRDTLGLREMVNWVLPENARLLPQTMLQRSVRSVRSWGVVLGMGLGLASDTLEFVEGRYDRQQYAAALTIDTGFTIASAVISGALAGAVTGAIVTGTAATVVLPIVGTVPGAIIGGLVGGVAGVFAALTLGTLFEGTGLRNLLIGKVADLYTRWTGGQN
jgi:hypothetical protein